VAINNGRNANATLKTNGEYVLENVASEITYQTEIKIFLW